MVDMVPLQSSNIAAAGYDEETRELTVQFASGSTYTYRDVGKDAFDGLVEAPSAGRYFATHIKGFYNFTQGG